MFHSTHCPCSGENSENSSLDSELNAIQKDSMLHSSHLFTCLSNERESRTTSRNRPLLKTCPITCFRHRIAGLLGRITVNKLLRIDQFFCKRLQNVYFYFYLFIYLIFFFLQTVFIYQHHFTCLSSQLNA